MEKLRSLARSTPVTLESWLLSFIGIVLIRTFFEQFSNADKLRYAFIDLPTIIHYGVFYLASILAFMAILVFFGKTSLKEVTTLSIFGFPIIIIPPMIDLVLAGSGGHVMTYLFIPGKDLLFSFLTFFGGNSSSGITIGIKTEIILVLMGIYFYIKHITKSDLRAIISVITFYCVIFIFLTVPSIFGLFLPFSENTQQSFFQSIVSSQVIQNNIHPGFYGNSLSLLDIGFNKTVGGIFALTMFFLISIFFFLGARGKFIAVLKNCRPERILHFTLLILFGWSLTGIKITNWIDWMGLSLNILAFTCAWLYSVCINDIHDQDGDTLSNKGRPLVSGKLSVPDMNIVSKILLTISILSAYLAGHSVLFFTLLFIIIYHIYSVPPLRLKRFFLINSFLVSIACLSAILSGFFLMSTDKNLTIFPLNLIFGIIIMFTLVSNLKDIKDTEGDRATGVITLSVLIGEKKAKLFISSIICFFLITIPYYFWIPQLLIPSIISSILAFKFINAQKYREWKFFVVYICFLSLFILFMFQK